MNTPTHCPTCDVPTATRQQFAKLTAEQQGRVGRRYLADGTCSRCYEAARAGRDYHASGEEIAYTGGWVNRGGVMHPVVRGGAA